MIKALELKENEVKVFASNKLHSFIVMGSKSEAVKTLSGKETRSSTWGSVVK